MKALEKLEQLIKAGYKGQGKRTGNPGNYKYDYGSGGTIGRGVKSSRTNPEFGVGSPMPDAFKKKRGGDSGVAGDKISIERIIEKHHVDDVRNALFDIKDQDSSIEKIRHELFDIKEQDSKFKRSNLTVRELRSVLFNVNDQNKTIRNLRSELFKHPNVGKKNLDLDKAVIPNWRGALLKADVR